MKKKIFLLIYLFLFIKIPTEASWEKRVYLATYPRSGNHWLRYLIEEATGIATSSVYRDREAKPDPIGKNHLAKRFPWGGFCPKNGYEGNRRYPLPDEPYVIKTHYPLLAKSVSELKYYKTIRLVRNPIDTFYSNFVFGNPSKKGERIPKANLDYFIQSWERFQKYWEGRAEVLTIRYEDLYNEPEKSLQTILEWIGYNVSEQDVKRAVEKYPPKDRILKALQFFEREDLALIHNKLSNEAEKYGYTIPIQKYREE